MNIDNDGATALAAGFVRCRSLKSLDLSYNVIGDEGLDAIVAGLARCFELAYNGFFPAVGLRSLATLSPAEMNLKDHCL